MSGADGSHTHRSAGNLLTHKQSERLKSLTCCERTNKRATHCYIETVLQPVNCLTFSVSSSVWSSGVVDVGSRRVSGFVHGSVFRHCSSLQVPLGSSLRGFSHRFLLHLPCHCTAHRVPRNSICVDLTLTPDCRMKHWNFLLRTIYESINSSLSALACYSVSCCGVHWTRQAYYWETRVSTQGQLTLKCLL